MNKLEKFVQEAKNFAQRNITADDPDFVAWNNSLIRFVEKKYGMKSTTTLNFKNRHYSLMIFGSNTPTSSFIQAYKKDMAITVKELEILLEEENEDTINEIITLENNKSINSKKIFIVHGRDNIKKYELSCFLYEQGLEPIILHEQVNNGQTIIEKIEKNSTDIACAIILLTPDDEGKLRDSNSPLKTRARQNVIFEAGYFMGKLGRNRTIILSGVEETMSDIDGIVYIDINNYKSALLKELKELNLIK